MSVIGLVLLQIVLDGTPFLQDAPKVPPPPGAWRRNSCVTANWQPGLLPGTVVIQRYFPPNPDDAPDAGEGGYWSCGLAVIFAADGSRTFTVGHVMPDGAEWFDPVSGRTGSVSAVGAPIGEVQQIRLDPLPPVKPAKQVLHYPLPGQPRTLWCAPLQMLGGRYGIACGMFIETDKDGDMTFDITIDAGSSGGPVFDERGRVVGLVNSVGGVMSPRARSRAFARPLPPSLSRQ